MRYNRALMQAILYGRVDIAKAVNVELITLDDAPRGYADFDAEALAKYRINPGNVGFKEKRDAQFATMIERAVEHAKPVRIGVNWGSLDAAILARLMDENAQLETL